MLIRTSSLTVLSLGLLVVSAVVAQQPVEWVSQPAGVDLESRFAAMQSELDTLRSEVAEIERMPPVSYYTGSHGCDRPIGGWYGGFELVTVRPHFQNKADFLSAIVFGGDGGDAGPFADGGADSDAGDADSGGSDGADGADGGDADSGDTDAADAGDADSGDFGLPSGFLGSIQPSYGFQATPRFFVGVRNEEGFGFRTRFWWLDADSDLFTDDLTGMEVTQSLGLLAFDFEMTQINCLGNLEMELGGGLRVAHTETASTVDLGIPFFATRFTNSFDGVGPTASINLRRPLLGDNFAAFGNFRGSLLFGDTSYQYDAVFTEDFTLPIDSGESSYDLVPVIETQIGLERNWWGERTRFSMRAAFEAQWWGSSVASVARDPFYLDDIYFVTDQDMGLVGATFSFLIEH